MWGFDEMVVLVWRVGVVVVVDDESPEPSEDCSQIR